jgi:hypothetical protein
VQPRREDVEIAVHQVAVPVERHRGALVPEHRLQRLHVRCLRRIASAFLAALANTMPRTLVMSDAERGARLAAADRGGRRP